MSSQGRTAVLALLTFTHPVDGRRFSDVGDNAFYWHFVTRVWLAICAPICLPPRGLAHG